MRYSGTNPRIGLTLFEKMTPDLKNPILKSHAASQKKKRKINQVHSANLSQPTHENHATFLLVYYKKQKNCKLNLQKMKSKPRKELGFVQIKSAEKIIFL